jgi:hypothetical protein
MAIVYNGYFHVSESIPLNYPHSTTVLWTKIYFFSFYYYRISVGARPSLPWHCTFPNFSTFQIIRKKNPRKLYEILSQCRVETNRDFSIFREKWKISENVQILSNSVPWKVSFTLRFLRKISLFYQTLFLPKILVFTKVFVFVTFRKLFSKKRKQFFCENTKTKIFISTLLQWHFSDQLTYRCYLN